MHGRYLQPLRRPSGRLLLSRGRDATPVLSLAKLSAPQQAISTLEVVATEGGAVTLVDLPTLQTRAEALQADADKAAQEAKSMRSLADNLWGQVGDRLIGIRDQWTPAPEAIVVTEQATSLTDRIAADDAELESRHAKEHGGISGLAFKVGSWNETRRLSDERAAFDSQLRTLLAQMARLSPQVPLEELTPTRDQAIAADAQALELEQHAASQSAAAATVGDEVKRRADAEHELGFDAPYLAAYLKTHGPQEVESPLILKRGEHACWVAPATLARKQTRTQWVGGSQGVSFPILHTGIRYRVGSYHGHPIQQQFLGNLDSGKLVITNLRLAFIGAAKSTSIPFAKLLHVECYSDAVAVFLEGRENPDFYLVAQPRYAIFMVNWFLNQAPPD